MKKFIYSAVTAAAIAASYAPQPARAALFGDDEARNAIIDLRTKVDALQRDVTAQLDSKANQKSVLDLAAQNEQLRQEIAKLHGQIEVLTNELANAQQRQKDFYVDLDNRLRKLEPRQVTIDGKEVSVDRSEQKTYDAALNLFKSGNYQAAAGAFTEFLRRYPQSGFAADAQYLLGNSYYAGHDYKNAIVAQQAVVRNFPDSPKAADALLNIANCQVALKDRPAARKTLQALLAKYPDAPAAQTAKERLPLLK